MPHRAISQFLGCLLFIIINIKQACDKQGPFTDKAETGNATDTSGWQKGKIWPRSPKAERQTSLETTYLFNNSTRD